MFRGKCRTTGNIYAVKRFRHPEKANCQRKEKAEAQFIHAYALREIAALTRLAHPHIIDVHEVVFTEMKNACIVIYYYNI